MIHEITIPKESPDLYTWSTLYEDRESGVSETDSNSFADVDQSRVKLLFLSPLDGRSTHVVEVPKGAEAVFFRRRRIELFLLEGQSNPRPTVHCIGWKRGEMGIYLFVFNDGSTLLTDNLQAV